MTKKTEKPEMPSGMDGDAEYTIDDARAEINTMPDNQKVMLATYLRDTREHAENLEKARFEYGKTVADALKAKAEIPAFMPPIEPTVSAEMRELFDLPVPATRIRKAGTGTKAKSPDNWLVLDGGKIAVHRWSACGEALTGSGSSKVTTQRALVNANIAFTIADTKPENAVEMDAEKAIEKITK